MGEKKGPSHQGVFGRIWERFGEVAKKLGLVAEADVERALSEQETMAPPRKRIGEILVEGGKLNADHIEQVLKHQRGEESKKAEAKKAPKKAPKKVAKKKAGGAKKKAPKAKAKAKNKK